MRYTHVTGRLLRTLATGPIVVLVTTAVYGSHGKALTAGLIDLVLIMLIAFRWGFIEAVAASVLSVGCLDYFYMVPIFSLYSREPQDWISSATFVAIALTAGHFVDRIKEKAAQTESERTRLERLYLTSRDIIIMDRSQNVGVQLTRLIVDAFNADAVALWDAREVRMDKAGKEAIPDSDVLAIYFHELCENDLAACRFRRVLRLGARPVGALYIKGSHHESHFDPRSVDAIASLSAIALERAHSFIAESNAEAAKRSEQLRSAVLDGLAHSFKTPLATIQSASSGLIEISNLGDAERELVSLIDEETTRLVKLTNQILRTARLDEGQLVVRHEKIPLTDLVELYKEQHAALLEDHPLSVIHERGVNYLWADPNMLQMALFQLLDNASKYASPKSPITLRVASTDTEVVFSVQNEGSFIAPEERIRIFQRFYRAPGSQYKASGTGIGLSVTKRIVEAHRGRVWVESDPDTITTFFLALPHIRKDVLRWTNHKENC